MVRLRHVQELKLYKFIMFFGSDVAPNGDIGENVDGGCGKCKGQFPTWNYLAGKAQQRVNSRPVVGQPRRARSLNVLSRHRECC
jgi:hypothetical protein